MTNERYFKLPYLSLHEAYYVIAILGAKIQLPLCL